MRKLFTALVIVTAALLWFMSPLPPDWPVTIHAQGGSSNYPTAFELLCPTVGAQPIGQFVTWNPNTQRWRANVCVDGSGNFSLGAGIASPGGANTQVQYNNGGVFAGSAGLTWNNASNILTVGQPSVATGSITIIGFNAGGNLAASNSGLQNTLTWSGPAIGFPTTTFASLPAVPVAGYTKYCTDCTTAATCAGSGTGHLAVSNGTNWTCQ